MPAGSFNKPMCLEIIDHGVSRYIIWPILSCTVCNSSAPWFGNLNFSLLWLPILAFYSVYHSRHCDTC